MIRTQKSFLISFVAASFLGSLASAEEPTQNETTTKVETTKKKVKRVKRVKTDPSDVTAGADNTDTNKRDRNSDEPTADDQKNNKSDLELTAQIRRSIVKDKSLSTNAHNIKIISQDGVITLKGPVASDAEKVTVEQKASAIAGESKVKSEIEIKP